ncbi:MAG TPA: lipopolysaccharide heptosyltransferase I [Candidatus Angelobacter sp.]|nr:lipopolysaccharide heptosyltransferase I [Candidatus Angelobacter sp.]
MVKILIVRLGALGDILHALPAVTAIRSALPQATIGWVVEENWSELLTAPGHKLPPEATGPQRPVVNLIHTVNTRRWRRHMVEAKTWSEIRGYLKRLRGVQYDVAIDFQGNIKSAVCARASAAREISGFVNPREAAARFLYARRFPRRGEHVIEQNLALANQAIQPCLAGQQLKLLAPQLPCDPAAEAWAQAEIARLGIGNFAMVTPGAGWGGKQWPAERFGQVARALAAHNLKTLVNAGPGEEDLANVVVQASGGGAVAVRCTIAQLIALTRRARIFLGGDTGPLHLAAALGIPVVAMFAPTDPARTGPFGTRAVVLRHPESKTTFAHDREPDEALLKISAEEVIGAARYLLGAAHA